MAKKRLKHRMNPNLTGTLLFLLQMSAVVLFFQAVLTPNDVYPSDIENHSGRFYEFQKLEHDSVDVVFLGTSHVMYGINPMEMYLYEGISAYNMGTSGQQIRTSYFLLEEVLKSQHPSVVMFDASQLYRSEFNEAQFRRALDEFLTGTNRLEAARAYGREKVADQYENIKKRLENGPEDIGSVDTDPVSYRTDGYLYSRGFLSGLFPIYYYHDRWKSLGQTDMDFTLKKNYFAQGYIFNSTIVSGGYDLSASNDAAEWMMGKTTARDTVRDYTGVTTEEESIELYDPVPGEDELYWLDKMADTCAAAGIQFLVFKVPVIQHPRYYPAWTKARSDALGSILAGKGIPYLDLLYGTDLETDLSTDFMDGGAHCNYLGAKKVSRYLASYLVDTWGVPQGRNEELESALPAYVKIKELAEFQMTTDLGEYLARLSDFTDGTVIFVSACGDYMSELSEESVDTVNEALGTAIPYGETCRGNSYIALIEDGRVRFEELSERRIDRRYQIGEDTVAEIISAGSVDSVSGSPAADILVKGRDYSANQPGLNLVVYDKETGQTVDSVVFRCAGNPSPLVWHANVNEYLKKYEDMQYRILRGVEE